MVQDFQFGLKNGKIVHARNVESGINCNCYCPSCGNPFVAYKGKVLRPHFKHLADVACHYSFETSLHYMAKEILQQKKYLDLPTTNWQLPCTPSGWFTAKGQNAPLVTEHGWQRVYFTKIEVEQWEGNFKPDLKCYVGDKQLLIEVTVTHGIDDAKLEKIKAKGLPLLEIDLSSFKRDITKRTLSRLLHKKNRDIHEPDPVFRWV